MNGTCFFLVTRLQWLPSESLRQCDLPIPFVTLLPSAYLYTLCSYLTDWWPFFQTCNVYSCFQAFAHAVFLNRKGAFYLFFFSKILNFLSKLSFSVFFQVKLSWYAQDCLFFTIIAQCLLQIGFTLFCFIGYFSTYLSVNTWKAGIIPYLYSFPLKKDWGY